MNELDKSEASYLSFNLGDERIAVVLRDESASMISGVVQRINPQYIRLRAPLSTSDMNHHQMNDAGVVGAVIPWSEIKLFWVTTHDDVRITANLDAKKVAEVVAVLAAMDRVRADHNK